MSLKSITFNIPDMVCTSCEKTIIKELKELGGVKTVTANYKKGTVSISYDNVVCSTSAITNAINKAGYSISDKKEGHYSEIVSIAAIILIALIIFKLGSNSGAFNMENALSTNASYIALFVIGIFTSLHCVGMCGGILLSQSITIDNKAPKGSLFPSFLYNLGRLVSYTLLGGIIGAVGSVFSLSLTTQAFISIVAAIFMIIMGLNFFGFKAFRGFSLRLPFSNTCKTSSISKRPFIIGLLNGFMPCGPLQTMQLYALATGSALAGATSMFFFALGTVPLMLGFGIVANLISVKSKKNFIKVSGLIIILLGLIMANRGLNLLGIRISPMAFATNNKLSSLSSETPGVALLTNGKQKVWVSATATGYSPSVVYIQKGIPTEFIVEGTTLTSCNNEIVIPSLNMRKKLSTGDTVFKFTPGDNDINYSCWMGMLNGTIKVVDDINSIDTSSINNLNTNSSLPLPGGCCGVGQ